MGQFEAQDFDVVVSSETVYILFPSVCGMLSHTKSAKLDHFKGCLVPLLACERNIMKIDAPCGPQQ